MARTIDLAPSGRGSVSLPGMDGDVERALESCAPPIRDLALRTCSLVLAIFPGAVVTVDDQNPRSRGV